MVSVADPEGGRGDVRPPKNKGEKRERERERERERDRQTDRERERERERGVVLLPSIIRLLNVINHYIFLPVALPFKFI